MRCEMTPQGVCSKKISFDLNGNVVTNVSFVGGCNGNLKAICKVIDGMTVEIIADGKHLPPELLRLIVKTKPLEDICLVTDSMRGAGMADGEHVLLGSLAHGQECIIDQGVAVLPDRSAFAGSVCTADRCVRTMYHLAGVKLEDAVRMMTYNPARVLGIQNRKGTLAAGMDADLVIFDDQILVKGVMVEGKQVI